MAENWGDEMRLVRIEDAALHKGFGLGLVFDALGGVLTGAAFSIRSRQASGWQASMNCSCRANVATAATAN